MSGWPLWDTWHMTVRDDKTPDMITHEVHRRLGPWTRHDAVLGKQPPPPALRVVESVFQPLREMKHRGPLCIMPPKLSKAKLSMFMAVHRVIKKVAIKQSSLPPAFSTIKSSSMLIKPNWEPVTSSHVSAMVWLFFPPFSSLLLLFVLWPRDNRYIYPYHTTAFPTAITV